MAKTSLFVFSIGPVQSFIASARKIEDLWSGSYLLSYLTESAIKAALSSQEVENIEMIFPHVNQSLLRDLSKTNVEIASLPNRFLCRVTTEEEGQHDISVVKFANEIETAIQREYKALCQFAIKEVFPSAASSDFINELAEKQIDETLELFWAFEHENSDYKKAREKLEKKLASVKNNRSFSSGYQYGLVCTVCSQRDALSLEKFSEQDNYNKMKGKISKEWERQVGESEGIIKGGERLCAVCLGKRLARRYFKWEIRKTGKGTFESFPSTTDIAKPTKYYAVIMMDGDDMGKWISGQDGRKLSGFEEVDATYHQNVSGRLTNYSRETVPAEVKRYNGKLIYAGGDDVLTFSSVKDALEMAASLRQAFSNRETGLDEKATGSTGIVIAHESAPLQMVLQSARQLEKSAKSYNNQEKNAFSLGVYTRNGEIRHVTLPWSLSDEEKPFRKGEPGCTVTMMGKVATALQNELATTFVHKFGEAFLPLAGSDILTGVKPLLSQALYPDGNTELTESDRRLIYFEISRLVGRSLEEKFKYKKNELAEILNQLYHANGSLIECVHLLEILRFFNKEDQMASKVGGN